MLRAKDTFRKMYSAAKGYYCGGLASPNAFSALDLRHSLSSSRKPPGHANPFRVCSYTQCALTNDSADQEVVIALGSNVGDRVNTFDRALRLMRSSGIKVTRHACLYETAGESFVGTEGIKRVMSVGNTMLDWRQTTLVMGVLNLTPNSFSDGTEKSWHSLSRSAVAGPLICGTSSAVNLLLEQKALKGACLLEIRCWTGVRRPLLWGCLTSRQTASTTEVSFKKWKLPFPRPGC